MSDEDAFLRAIADNLDDDAPRLVYADWLDEHGDPVRAEYLRLLCRVNQTSTVDRLRELAPALDPAWVARVCREYPLAHAMYVVLRPVACGDMTSVFEATTTHPDLGGRRVALRVLNDGRNHARFLDACRVHAAVEHEHIPPLYEVGERDGRLYAARMFVDGDDLLNNIRGRAVAPADLVRLVAAVASAVDAMHVRGVLHGCVHPRHVLQGRDGSIWLIGLGEWPPGESIGNPLHLAPEQLEPGRLPSGPPTDVYQLAETAAWLLAGRHPFQDWHRPEPLLAAKRLEDGWHTGPLRNLPNRVATAFGRALAPDPADRFPTTGDFAAALAAAFGRRPRFRWRFW